MPIEYGIDRWFHPDIWVKEDNDFWVVMESAGIAAGFLPRNKHNAGRPAAPLTHYPFRDLHEMAHYLQCEDHEVFDPFYGSTTFTFRQDDKQFFSDDDYLKELEVFVIQAILENSEPVSYASSAMTFDICEVKGFEEDDISLLNEENKFFRFTYSLAHDLLKKWGCHPLSKLWEEKERKDALVLSQIDKLKALREACKRNFLTKGYCYAVS